MEWVLEKRKEKGLHVGTLISGLADDFGWRTMLKVSTTNKYSAYVQYCITG